MWTFHYGFELTWKGHQMNIWKRAYNNGYFHNEKFYLSSWLFS